MPLLDLVHGQTRKADDGGEHVVEIMRDAARQPADALHLLSLQELRLDLFLAGHILGQSREAEDFVLLIQHGKRSIPYPADFPVRPDDAILLLVGLMQDDFGLVPDHFGTICRMNCAHPGRRIQIELLGGQLENAFESRADIEEIFPVRRGQPEDFLDVFGQLPESRLALLQCFLDPPAFRDLQQNHHHRGNLAVTVAHRSHRHAANHFAAGLAAHHQLHPLRHRASQAFPQQPQHPAADRREQLEAIRRGQDLHDFPTEQPAGGVVPKSDAAAGFHRKSGQRRIGNQRGELFALGLQGVFGLAPLRDVLHRPHQFQRPPGFRLGDHLGLFVHEAHGTVRPDDAVIDRVPRALIHRHP